MLNPTFNIISAFALNNILHEKKTYRNLVVLFHSIKSRIKQHNHVNNFHYFSLIENNDTITWNVIY